MSENQYELAVDTLDMYFETTREETLKSITSYHELAEELKRRGADRPEERAQAVEFAFGDQIPETDGVDKLSKSDVSGQSKEFFIPLTKVDERRREVYGYAAVEEPDNSDEIMDYASSKPHWIEWSTSAQKRSGGRSMGNLRAMHKSIAAGKLTDFRPDDERKGFWIGAKVVDDDEWKKVQAGVYTGFSVGGKYVKRWNDALMRKMRYTAKPAEVSLVDAPCIPSATFQVIKADGATEERPFQAAEPEPEETPEIEEMVEETEPENEEEVEKLDAPTSPETAGSIDAEGTQVEKIPTPDTPMPLNPDNPPTGDEIAARHGVQNLESAAAEASGNPPTGTRTEKSVSTHEIRKIKVIPAEKRLVKVRKPRMLKIFRSTQEMK